MADNVIEDNPKSENDENPQEDIPAETNQVSLVVEVFKNSKEKWEASDPGTSEKQVELPLESENLDEITPESESLDEMAPESSDVEIAALPVENLVIITDKFFSEEIQEIASYKITTAGNCILKIKTAESETQWTLFQNVDKYKVTRWLTKAGLKQTIQNFDEEKNEFSDLLDAETDDNLERLVFDNFGAPRFLNQILGVTQDQNFIEFIVSFKYSRQERIIHGDRLKHKVPQMVIAFYEKNINFGTEKLEHYTIDEILED